MNKLKMLTERSDRDYHERNTAPETSLTQDHSGPQIVIVSRIYMPATMRWIHKSAANSSVRCVR